MSRLHRIRCHPGIMAIVALTWLPYMSVRCIDATSGCLLLGAEHEAQERSDHEESRARQHGCHAEDDGPAAHHDDGKSSAPKHTCCELTGKYAVDVTSWTPTVSPAVAIAAVEAVDVLPTAMRVPRVRCSADPTHHPPPYIRFASLLI